MVPVDAGPGDRHGVHHRRKGEKEADTIIKKRPARQKKAPGPYVPGPEDIPGEVKCNYPHWEKFLDRYPMINSIQREDFPEYGVSFVYVAHFYRTIHNAEESSLSQEEFGNFFREIGYEYDYSGNYDSRWYEGIGVRIT